MITLLFGHWWILEQDVYFVIPVAAIKVVSGFTILMLASKVLVFGVVKLSTVFIAPIFSTIYCLIGIYTGENITLAEKETFFINTFWWISTYLTLKAATLSDWKKNQNFSPKNENEKSLVCMYFHRIFWEQSRIFLFNEFWDFNILGKINILLLYL